MGNGGSRVATGIASNDAVANVLGVSSASGTGDAPSTMLAATTTTASNAPRHERRSSGAGRRRKVRPLDGPPPSYVQVWQVSDTGKRPHLLGTDALRRPQGLSKSSAYLVVLALSQDGATASVSNAKRDKSKEEHGRKRHRKGSSGTAAPSSNTSAATVAAAASASETNNSGSGAKQADAGSSSPRRSVPLTTLVEALDARMTPRGLVEPRASYKHLLHVYVFSGRRVASGVRQRADRWANAIVKELSAVDALADFVACGATVELSAPLVDVFDSKRGELSADAPIVHVIRAVNTSHLRQSSSGNDRYESGGGGADDNKAKAGDTGGENTDDANRDGSGRRRSNSETAMTRRRKRMSDPIPRGRRERSSNRSSSPNDEVLSAAATNEDGSATKSNAKSSSKTRSNLSSNSGGRNLSIANNLRSSTTDSLTNLAESPPASPSALGLPRSVSTSRVVMPKLALGSLGSLRLDSDEADKRKRDAELEAAAAATTKPKVSGGSDDDDDGKNGSDGPTLPPRDPALPSPAKVPTMGKAELLRVYSNVCSKVTELLYMGGQYPARNAAQLRENGITHVLNLAGSIVPSCFRDQFKYLTLALLDGQQEDLTCLFYPVIEWMEAVERDKGAIYVHCHAGVSRSSSFVIIYMMWKYKWAFQPTHEFVKKCRPTASPNAGFMGQILQWWRRISKPLPSDQSRLYRMAIHSYHFGNEPQIVVARYIPDAQRASLVLDARTSYVLHTPDAVYVYHGAESSAEYRDGALACCRRLQRFEAAPTRLLSVDASMRDTDDARSFYAALGSEQEPPSADADDGADVSKRTVAALDADYSPRARDRLRNSLQVIADKYKELEEDDTALEQKVELYLYPNNIALATVRETDFERVSMFDHADLDENCLYILYSPPSTTAQRRLSSSDRRTMSGSSTHSKVQLDTSSSSVPGTASTCAGDDDGNGAGKSKRRRRRRGSNEGGLRSASAGTDPDANGDECSLYAWVGSEFVFPDELEARAFGEEALRRFESLRNLSSKPQHYVMLEGEEIDEFWEEFHIK